MSAHDGSVNSICFDSTGKLIASAGKDNIILWESNLIEDLEDSKNASTDESLLHFDKHISDDDVRIVEPKLYDRNDNRFMHLNNQEVFGGDEITETSSNDSENFKCKNIQEFNILQDVISKIEMLANALSSLEKRVLDLEAKFSDHCNCSKD